MSDAPDRSVAGDDDRWMLFDRRTDDGYALVIRSRTGNPLVEDALRRDIITIVACVADVTLVADSGMPQRSDQLYDVEDGLTRQLQAIDVGAFHAASITGDGRRDIVLTHARPVDFDQILRLFEVPGYTFGCSEPGNREALIERIAATPLEMQLNGDQGVISNLENNGDDGCAPRKTDFWFYGERHRLEALSADLAPWGYGVDHWLDDPAGVVLTCVTPVDYDTFQNVTPVMAGAAERHGVEYDGWETLVVQDSPEEPVSPPKPASLLAKLFGAKKN